MFVVDSVFVFCFFVQIVVDVLFVDSRQIFAGGVTGKNQYYLKKMLIQQIGQHIDQIDNWATLTSLIESKKRVISRRNRNQNNVNNGNNDLALN